MTIRWTNTCNLYTGDSISGKRKCCDRPVDETRLHDLQTQDSNTCSNKKWRIKYFPPWIHSRQCERYLPRVLAGEYSQRVLACEYSWQCEIALTEQHLSDIWWVHFHWCPFHYMLRRAACKLPQLQQNACTYRTNSVFTLHYINTNESNNDRNT